MTLIPYEVTDRTYLHPWTGEYGWVTETWTTASHEDSEALARDAKKAGWSIWLVGNSGTPCLAVYREVEEDE